MGLGPSKEEQLYQAALNGNHQLVKSLRRDGASLEWMDKEGRTPLILASTRAELFDMVVTLVNLGANMNAYRPGSNGGFPLHHAAKRGLEKTVIFLISRGADPLAVNDDGQTPLDMARSRGHTSVVRIIEDRVSLFSGTIREVSGPGLLEVLMPQWLTKKVWAVVLPTESRPIRSPRFELLIYQSQKVAEPRTTISLWKTELEEPKPSSPVLIVTDKTAKARHKLLPEVDGDFAQIERLYRACIGILPDAFAMGYPVPQQSQVPDDDVALAMALSASLQQTDPSTNAVDDVNGWADQGGQETYNGWGPNEAKLQQGPPQQKPSTTAVTTSTGAPTASYGGWEDGESSSKYSGWEAGPSNAPSREEAAAAAAAPSTAASDASAPPLPPEYELGPISYPSIDTSPVSLQVPQGGHAAPTTQSSSSTNGAAAAAASEKPGTCVVCWDAPAQGVCIPCGHMAGCMDCLTEIQKKKWGCPVCRTPIEQVVKVYAV